MAAEAVEIRPAEDGDRLPLALLFAAVAEERDGIAAEPPIDVALYRKFGFLEEGRRTKHMRRADRELWDLIEMGLLL